MNLDNLATIYGYNAWATRRILAAAARVSPEQYAAPAAHSFSSLRATLVHMLDTEYGWRVLCQHGTISFDDITEANTPTLALLDERWRDEERAMRAYLAGLGDADLTSLVRYTTGEGVRRERVLWHCLLHLVNHGTQHRSEAAAILTGYGCSPGDLDFTMFLNER